MLKFLDGPDNRISLESDPRIVGDPCVMELDLAQFNLSSMILSVGMYI